MKQLWAPWRSDYVQSAEKDGKCVFCEAAKNESEDHHLLFCGAVSAVMLNKYPYNPGHLMVSPRRHAARIEELSPEESLDIFRLVRHSITVLTKVYNPEGYNIGMNIGKVSGAGIVDHLHMHIVPRWGGDTNFMPVLADVKLISVHIADAHSRLKPFFERI